VCGGSQRGIAKRASDEARRAKKRRTAVRTGAVPFHFAELPAKGGGWFDVADNGGEDLIESAAVELEKLLDRQAVRIMERFALSHGRFLSW
jgi:hypothetical protein